MRRLIAAVPRGVPLLAMLAALPAAAQNLSPQEVFRRVAPSVVVIEIRDAPENGPSRVIASGSGVVVPDRSKDAVLIATNCHVVEKSPYGAVGIKQGDEEGLGWIEGRDTARDLCMVRGLFPGAMSKDGEVSLRKLPAVQVGASQSLEVGDPVYAVGAPQGLELSLSDGLVSGFREYKGSEYIQTTAPISKGSSGGGLFDAQGRLVGITTMYVKDGQALNFAVPAELIAAVPRIIRKTTSAPSTPTGATAAQAAADAAAEAADTSTPQKENKSRDRWRTLYDDDERRIAFDMQTVRRDGGNVTVWIRTTFRSPRTGSDTGTKYIESTSRETYFCGSRQSSFDQVIWRNQKGEVVGRLQLKSHEVKRDDLVPDTIGEFTYAEACSL